MKILLVGNLPEDGQESMQRFTTLLRTGLEARGHTVAEVSPRLRLARLGPRYRYAGVPKYLGYFDKFVLFPRELRRRVALFRPDVVHVTDHANVIYASAVDGAPVLATCHDLLQARAASGELPPQRVGRLGRQHQNWIRTSLGRIPLVACVSTQTRADLLRLTALAPTQVALIPNALNFPYRPIAGPECQARLAVLAARHRLSPDAFGTGHGGFLLHVGGAHWYKNRPGLLEIYARLRSLLSPAPTLVMVGPALANGPADLASQLGLDGHLVSLPSVTNPELEALYNGAEALLFPSWEEGFGWPIAEAQACGCAVFASDRAPMTEVGGRSSVYFDPHQPDDAARKIAARWPERAAHRALALREAERWQPSLMLAAYEELYHRLTR